MILHIRMDSLQINMFFNRHSATVNRGYNRACTGPVPGLYTYWREQMSLAMIAASVLLGCLYGLRAKIFFETSGVAMFDLHHILEEWMDKGE